MSATLSLVIGIILALAGLGLLIYLVASSPIRRKNREKLRKQLAKKRRCKGMESNETIH